ncbi:transposase domain-containing protein [Actinacidiphila glaucinigra]|uniref:transposase domain-containing protein n=1 Tax=Actinacidiphila glaucinigra TaxID=235986 RepID=UPI0036CCB15C
MTDAFTAGHLGELTRYVPFDLVDAVLAETGRIQKRLRLLPSRVGVYRVSPPSRTPSVRGLIAARGPVREGVATSRAPGRW